jgi:hypothetical protein
MKFAGRKRAPAISPPMSGRGTSLQAKAPFDRNPRDVLDKLEGDHSLAGLIQTLSQDFSLDEDELAILAGVSTETVVQWARADDAPCVERLDDLGDIAALLIRDGGMGPRSVTAWLRSRNRDLSWSRPLDVLRRRGFLPVHGAAEAACGVSPGVEREEAE